MTYGVRIDVFFGLMTLLATLNAANSASPGEKTIWLGLALFLLFLTIRPLPRDPTGV